MALKQSPFEPRPDHQILNGRQSDPFVSVFNDVLGPVMRGPSSSHTAGSYHIARTARELLRQPPRSADITFDSDGSYAGTYSQQGVDHAFATGIMGWELTDSVFLTALQDAGNQGVDIRFHIGKLPRAEHPNHVLVELEGDGDRLVIEAQSTGGGTFIVSRVDGYRVRLDGKSHSILVKCSADDTPALLDRITNAWPNARTAAGQHPDGGNIITASSCDPLPTDLIERCRLSNENNAVRNTGPIYHVQRGTAPFLSAAGMTTYAARHNWSLGEAVLRYETTVLGITEDEALAEMHRRYRIMKQAVADGFVDNRVDMLLLEPSAGKIRRRIDENRVPIGGVHAKAAAAALAVMHTCNSRGVVCAAPTGGAAGTLPGTLTALEEAVEIDRRRLALMLFAAGGIGLVLAMRGTFAAEVAGCQVEIGAAGAMASAAVVEFAGGHADQACDAAAVSFQNTMGSVCDLVQGICELPCHTRNAAAASSALTNADLILGGYRNPVPLDETIDAVHDCGRLLPSELRCTARGGLALAPSAKGLSKRR